MRKESCGQQTFSNETENIAVELEVKRKRNEALLSEIQKIELELKELKKINNKILQEKNEYEYKKNVIQQSYQWRFSKKVISVLRSAKYKLPSVRKKKDALKLKKKAEQRIKKQKYCLYEQGFTDRAVSDLHKVVHDTQNIYLRRLAAWELALWYANQSKKDSAQKCLELLPKATAGVEDTDFLRRVAIIKAECLERINHTKDAKLVIARALEREAHGDLYLAAANLESSVSKRLEWINRALQLCGLSQVYLRLDTGDSLKHQVYDCLESNPGKTTQHVDAAKAGPKVTVIIPAYNAENVIRSSLDSVLAQTWTNLEIIVVDDCSTDTTVEIVKTYVQRDARVQLIRTETNSGPYVARNLALSQATGDFVTVNDADDWSHPEKIESQVHHLIENPSVIANTSQQARATESLRFYRRGKPGEYIFANLSSLMFRREPVMEKLGYWDSVRFGADGEFKRRLEKVFGAEAVVDLKTGPLSFQRQSIQSLTGNKVFGFHGYFMGARKEYFDSYQYYHQTGKTLKYGFPQKVRPFAVPEPMKPERYSLSERRHFDVILVSEFRLLGGTNMSNAEEIKAQKQFGLRTGLIQMSRYDFNSAKSINPKIRELIDGQQVQMIVYGERVSCDLLIVRHPPVLHEWQRFIPDVKADNIRVIVNQPPRRDYGEEGELLYDIRQCAHNLKRYFGKEGIWHPIGPSVRAALQEYHADELQAIHLSDEDWVNIIDVKEWRRLSRPLRGSKIRIGRHSRPQYVKWPDDPEELLAVYPDTDDIEVHILGGAQIPRKILGYLPDNWRVYEYDEVQPKDFLASLDIFVYYTHPNWVEAFGRVIFEAMAVGVPVIIPPAYRSLFGEAAIYAEPREVRHKIEQLMKDDDYYNAQVKKAHEYVEHHFGYFKHASRLKEIVGEKSLG